MNDKVVDYRKMYYRMASTVETVIRLLIQAQRDCEDILLEQDIAKTDLQLVSQGTDDSQ